MATMLEALRAVRDSELSPPARHVMMTLISLSDPETCVIPDRFTPSLSDLKKFTGLSRSTVAVQLNSLECAGWLKRDKPDAQRSWRDKERTRYFVLVPTSPGDGLVRETDMSGRRTSPGDGLRLVREPDCTSPGDGHALRAFEPSNQEPSTSDPTSEPPKPARKPEPQRPDVEQVCKHLADSIEAIGSKRPRVTDAWRKDVRLLLDEKRSTPTTPEKVIALIDWAHNDSFWKKNIQSATKLRKHYDTLRLSALEEWKTKHGEQQKRRNGFQPYLNPDDNSAYDDWQPTPLEELA